MKDNVLVLGNGGREDAIRWKLAQSQHVENAYMLPADTNHDDIANFCRENRVKLVKVGPEKPLVDGVADYLRRFDIRVFGPCRHESQLESSKAFAKRFMSSYGIPTAEYKDFSNPSRALGYAWKNLPVYIKADGLAGGKGAISGDNHRSAANAIMEIMLEGKFGGAGNRVVVEEKLNGEEASCMAFMNSLYDVVIPLFPSQDHKKLLDGDNGPNTGGMGAYSPTKLITPGLRPVIERNVFFRTLAGIKDSRMNYLGTVYPGLMIDGDDFYVLEYNVRMGDPETQVVLPLMKSDLYEVLNDVIDGRNRRTEWHPGYAVCVVLASKGYPEWKEVGKEIYGLDERGQPKNSDVLVFHAGTKKQDGKFYTNGGRDLGITARGETIGEAIKRVYSAIGPDGGIWFEGMQYRTDIGRRELERHA